MKKFTTCEQIRKFFVADGWNENITFAELSLEQAIEKGLNFAVSSIQKGRKYFVMNPSGNIYDECGRIAYFNI